ncbi:hypothetical protein BG006_003154 [Podila minutissima]|uniref:Uncharacterized protein n=1 Tax=Podila minutissima TaxID=64525 RepID=A0A9P5SQS1_9FUNG|nr:hypothetical protein BG006_003154 [Podila minutissima]
MSAKQSKVAATYSGAGIRAEAKKSKVVFKNVLDTPFNVPWPEVSNDSNAIVLDVLCELLKPIKNYHHTHSAEIKKEKKSRKKEAKEKNKKTAQEGAKPNPVLATISTPLSSKSTTTETPLILAHAVIGINSVTKELEKSIQNIKDHPPPSAIYVCKDDLSPAHLYSHIGTMVAMLPGTLLFPLTRGSEKKLAEALGMQAVGAVAIKAGSTEATDLVMVTSRMVEPINVSWLPKATAPVVKDKTPVTSKPETMPTESDRVIKTTSTSEPPSTTPNTSGTIKDGSSQTWIPTNIKAVKTVMPIVTKTPQKPNANTHNNNSTSQGKGQKQPQNQQKGNNNNNSDQMNKGKKHSSDPSDGQGERGKGKKAKNK